MGILTLADQLVLVVYGRCTKLIEMPMGKKEKRKDRKTRNNWKEEGKTTLSSNISIRTAKPRCRQSILPLYGRWVSERVACL